MTPERKRKYIKRAIERMKKAEPYSDSEFECILNNLPDDIFHLPLDSPAPIVEIYSDRYIATEAKRTLDRYFSEHPEDSIENYMPWELDKDYIIREMKESEYPLLEDFLYEAIFIPDGVEPPPKSIIESPELQVYIEKFGTQKHDRAFVAEVDHQIIGAVWVRLMNDYGHVDEETPSFAISLYKAYREKGIGTELMRKMLTTLKHYGYAKASLAVQKANYAVSMYQKLGFEIFDENEEEYIMINRLQGSLFEHTKNTRAIIKNSFRYIRSDVPVFLSDQERQWLLEHDVKTIIDLREEIERQQKPCILENDDDFHYISLPVTGGNAVPESASQVAVSYINMVDDMMKMIIQTIMNADTNVLYFCNAGKDRTGVVSAIILSELGYSRQYIIEDYLLSGINLKEELKSFARSNPDIDIEVITPKAEYMEKFLTWYQR